MKRVQVLKESFELYNKNTVACCTTFRSEGCHFFQPSSDFWRTGSLSSTTFCHKVKKKCTSETFWSGNSSWTRNTSLMMTIASLPECIMFFLYVTWTLYLYQSKWSHPCYWSIWQDAKVKNKLEVPAGFQVN